MPDPAPVTSAILFSRENIARSERVWRARRKFVFGPGNCGPGRSGEHTRLACWSQRPAATNFRAAYGRAATDRLWIPDALRKFVSAGRRNQHAGRVRSPECDSPRETLRQARGAERLAAFVPGRKPLVGEGFGPGL